MDKKIEYIRRDDAIRYAQWEGAYKVVMYLEEMPAADVQRVRHGRWIKVQGKLGDNFLCSNCGTAEETESGQDGAVWWHDEYCRKCGARMDGDTDA